MPFKDIEKRREYRRKWYSQNKLSEKNHVLKRKKNLKIWLIEYKKNLKCYLCSENHPATLDFHHNSGKKNFEISYMIANGYSIDNIKRELELCQVLCSNCHRKKHYQNKKL